MSQSTYERILNAAFEHFADNGFEKASMNDIAKIVGISKPALYHHFDSKDSLLETLYEQLIALIQADFISDIDAISREAFLETLVSIGLSDLTALRHQPRLARILQQYNLLSLRSSRVEALSNALEKATYQYHMSIMKHGEVLGLIQPGEGESMANLFYALLSGLTWSQLRGVHTDVEEVWKDGVQRLMGAMA
mgnify:CR=1 FL=1